jgi:hypothetical protein
MHKMQRSENKKGKDQFVDGTIILQDSNGYCSQYANIVKVFFKPRHTGHPCPNDSRGHCRATIC